MDAARTRNVVFGMLDLPSTENNWLIKKSCLGDPCERIV